MFNSFGFCIDYEKLIKKIGNNGVGIIKKSCTISTKCHNNIFKKLSCFDFKIIDNINYFIVPKFIGLKLAKKNIIEYEYKIEERKNITFDSSTLILNNNQNIVCDEIKRKLLPCSILSSCIIQSDPGTGKTYIAAGMIKILQKKTIIIVPNVYLLKQTFEVMSELFPNNKIGCYYGLEKTDGDIIIAVINSALYYDKYETIGFVILDEVHGYCSKTMSNIFNVIHTQFILGITATPDIRLDGFDKMLNWYLGDIIIAKNIPGWNADDIKFTTRVIQVVYNGPPKFTESILSSTGIVSVPHMITMIQSDPDRNKIIINYAIELYQKGKNVFVFSDRRDHLHNLAELLKNTNIPFEAPELNIIKLMGGSSSQTIEDAKTHGRLILTTYQYSSTGVSIVKMNSLVLATPRRNGLEQIIGRIYRLSGDQNIERVIVDIVDNRTCLKSQFYDRKKIYDKKTPVYEKQKY